MKKFFSVFLVAIICVCIFSGCAKVSYSVLVYPDGSIEQGFEVVLDKDELEQKQYNFESSKEYVKNKMITILNNQKLKIMLYAMDRNINLNASGIECNYKEISDNQLYVYIYFPSMIIFQDYKNFVNQLSGETEEEEKDNTTIEQGIFFVKNIERTTTVYHDIENDDFVKEIMQNFNNFSLNDVEYNFYYGLPSDKLYSENSEVFTQDGITIHHWKFNASELNNEIVTYTLNVKPSSWYIFALIITFVLIGVLLLIYFLQKKFKKSKNSIVQDEN